MHLLDTLLSLVFPVSCVLCKAQGKDLCIPCLSLCPEAERDSPAWVFPLYDYRHPGLKLALRLFKYKGKRRLAPIFAEVLYEKMIEEIGELGLMENFREPLLLPIPLSRRRERERGYNQAELISKEIVKIDALRSRESKSGMNFEPVYGVLRKPKETEHQARIKDRSLRMKNIRGTFSIADDTRIKNRNIILIDDILTTGATLSEARRVLKRAGARKVIAFTIAH